MKPAINLKKKLAATELTLGILITNHLWLELIEVAREAGLDYVVVDCEHFGHDNDLVANACALGRQLDFAVFLRPPSTNIADIRPAMDIGPCGLLLPTVEDTAQLDMVRDGAYMPPRGSRRPGGPGNRWVKTFNYDTFKQQVEDHLIVIPQIETARGLENACSLAEHEITTALGIGPFDLSAQLGVCGQRDHPAMEDAVNQIREAAKQAGKPAWMIGNGEKLMQQGFHFLCIGEPTYMLQATITQAVDQLRGNSDELPEAHVP